MEKSYNMSVMLVNFRGSRVTSATFEFGQLPGQVSRRPPAAHPDIVLGIANGCRRQYRLLMSAVELLKQVKALPRREREKLLLAALEMEEEPSRQLSGKSKAVKWPDIEERARRIFGERIVPNLVLMERAEASF